MKKKVGLIIVAVIVIILICVCCSKKETKEETSKIESISGAVTQSEAIKVDDKSKEEAVKEEDKENNNTSTSTSTASSSNKSNSKTTVKESSVTPSPSSNSPSSNDNASKPDIENTENKPTHTHNWVAVYGTRTIPVYESIRVVICDDCGAIVSDAGGMGAEERSAHMNMHIDNGDKYGGGTHSETRKIQTGTTTEKYISSYKCSCGATK